MLLQAEPKLFNYYYIVEMQWVVMYVYTIRHECTTVSECFCAESLIKNTPT